jgi:hypothetical protein
MVVSLLVLGIVCCLFPLHPMFRLALREGHRCGRGSNVGDHARASRALCEPYFAFVSGAYEGGLR